MADGTVKAGALKNVPYYCAAAVRDAHAELEALRVVVDKPYLVQCLAAFRNTGADGCGHLAITPASAGPGSYGPNTLTCCGVLLYAVNSLMSTLQTPHPLLTLPYKSHPS